MDAKNTEIRTRELSDPSGLEFYALLGARMAAAEPSGAGVLRPGLFRAAIWLKKTLALSSRPRRHHLQATTLRAATRLGRAEERPDGPQDAHVAVARQALLEAATHIGQVRNNRALQALHRFDEIMVAHEPVEDLRADVLSLAAECETPQFAEVKPTILEQLKKVSLKTDDAALQERAYLRKAVELRNAHVEGQFVTKSLLRSLLIVLGLCLLLLLIAGLALAETLDFAGIQTGSGAAGAERTLAGLGSGGFLLATILGAIGATLSAMMNFANCHQIPDVFTSFFVTLVRPFIGAASGFVAAFLFTAGVVPLGTSASAFLLTAFALGFSERLVLGVIGRLDFRHGSP